MMHSTVLVVVVLTVVLLSLECWDYQALEQV